MHVNSQFWYKKIKKLFWGPLPRLYPDWGRDTSSPHPNPLRGPRRLDSHALAPDPCPQTEILATPLHAFQAILSCWIEILNWLTVCMVCCHCWNVLCTPIKCRLHISALPWITCIFRCPISPKNTRDHISYHNSLNTSQTWNINVNFTCEY